MARKKKSRGTPASEPRDDAEGGSPDSLGAAASTVRRRDPRPVIYAVVDLILAALWVVLITQVTPTRHAGGQLLLWGMVVLGVAMAAGMFVPGKWGWRIGAAACGALIVIWIGLVIVLVMTAGFLSGVYGGFGQAAAMGSLLIAFVSLQLIALVPALQLKFLLTRAGRRHFQLEPLWK